MTAKRRAAEAHQRRWLRAVSCMDAVPPWLAFRYLLARQYNDHQPQGAVQHAAKTRAAALAASLVEGMGGALYAPQPPGLEADGAWLSFTEAITPLGAEHYVGLMWRLWGAQWGGPPRDPERWLQMQALDLTLGAMRTQQRVNFMGWSAESGWPKIRARRRS